MKPNKVIALAFTFVLLLASIAFAQSATPAPDASAKASCCDGDKAKPDCCAGKDGKMCDRKAMKDGKMACCEGKDMKDCCKGGEKSCCGDKAAKGDKTAKAGSCGSSCDRKAHGAHAGA